MARDHRSAPPFRPLGCCRQPPPAPGRRRTAARSRSRPWAAPSPASAASGRKGARARTALAAAGHRRRPGPAQPAGDGELPAGALLQPHPRRPRQLRRARDPLSAQPSGEDSPHALHGIGWQREWTVQSAGPTKPCWRWRWSGAAWPWRFSARQPIACTPTAWRCDGAHQRGHGGDAGRHRPPPVLPARTRHALTTDGEAMWEADDEVMPTGLAQTDVVSATAAGRGSGRPAHWTTTSPAGRARRWSTGRRTRTGRRAACCWKPRRRWTSSCCIARYAPATPGARRVLLRRAGEPVHRLAEPDAGRFRLRALLPRVGSGSWAAPAARRPGETADQVALHPGP
jgi:hypothetical protein